MISTESSRRRLRRPEQSNHRSSLPHPPFPPSANVTLPFDAWIGNSELVAARHYLQLTDDHFRRATEAAQNPAQKVHESARNGEQADSPKSTQAPEDSEACASLGFDANCCEHRKIPEVGLEPTRGVNLNGF